MFSKISKSTKRDGVFIIIPFIIRFSIIVFPWLETGNGRKELKLQQRFFAQQIVHRVAWYRGRFLRNILLGNTLRVFETKSKTRNARWRIFNRLARVTGPPSIFRATPSQNYVQHGLHARAKCCKLALRWKSSRITCLLPSTFCTMLREKLIRLTYHEKLTLKTTTKRNTSKRSPQFPNVFFR